MGLSGGPPSSLNARENKSTIVPKRPAISITLTAYNMGPESTEEDFDHFAHYVAKHIDKRFGAPVAVEQFKFTGGPDHDAIDGADHEEEDSIHRIAEALWLDWCDEGGTNEDGNRGPNHG